MSEMQGLQHISSEHVFWLNYAKCRIQLKNEMFSSLCK